MDHDLNAHPLERGENIVLPPPNQVVRGLMILVFAGCGLYALLFLYHGVRLVLYPGDLDNSEAYLVYQGARLAHGESLYSPIDQSPYLVDNYPPLYPVVEAIGFLFTGPNFHWPRLISLLSTCVAAWVLSFWTWRLTRRRMAAVLAGLIYLSFYHVYDWGALARVDALGIALALTGVLFFEIKRSWIWALPWILLAGLTRQTLFAAPLAILFTLVLRDHRDALRFMVVSAGCIFIVSVVLMFISHGRVWNHLVVYNVNEYRLSDVRYYVTHWLRFYSVWGSVPLWILLTCYSKQKTVEAQNFSLLFGFTFFAIGEALLCGKIGSAPNYLLSLVAAASVGFGVAYHSLAELGNANRKPLMILLCACLTQLAATWHWPHQTDFSLTPTRTMAIEAKRLTYDLEKIPGPVLSDLAGIPLMAGHPPIYEPFIITQLTRQGLWDQTRLLARIQAKEFSRLVLRFDLSNPDWDRERFTPEIIEAMRSSYTVERRAGTFFPYFIYRPKE